MNWLLVIGYLLIAPAKGATRYDACAAVHVSTQSWAVIRTKGLSFSFPHAFKRTAVTSRSELGEETWSNGSAQLFIGYGLMNEKRMRKTYRAGVICESMIDGERTIMTTGRYKEKDGTVLWFPGIHPWVRDDGTTKELHDSTLLFWGDGKTSTDQKTLLAAFQTIKFQNKRFVGTLDKAIEDR